MEDDLIPPGSPAILARWGVSTKLQSAMRMGKSLSDGMEKLRTSPLIVSLVLLVAVVGAVASFTDSVSKLIDLFPRQDAASAREELSKLGIPFTAQSLQDKAHDGDLAAVKKLLQAGLPPDVVAEDRDDDRPNLPALAEAATRGDLPMVQLLLANHADPSADRGAAVKAAAHYGHTAVLQLLLKQQLSDHDMSEALISAAFQMKLDTVRILAARLQNPKEALSEALWRTSNFSGWGDEDFIVLNRTLLKLGADPNFTDDNGVTPLMLAAHGGTSGQVRTLIEAGASVNARCTCPDWPHGGGWTALGLAAYRGSNATDVSQLILAGADVNARNIKDETPLMLAAGRPSMEAVKALLDAGADVNARSSNGENAIDIATRGYVWPDKTVYFPELVALLRSHMSSD